MNPHKIPVDGEDELKSQAQLDRLEFGYIDTVSYRTDPFKIAGPNDDKWPGSRVPPTPASADPERAKALGDALASMRVETEIPSYKTIGGDWDDSCKPGPEWIGRDYMRDRSGSKKKIRKRVKRAKARASKLARKAQR